MIRLDADLHVSIAQSSPTEMARAAVDNDIHVIAMCERNIIRSRFQLEVYRQIGLEEGVVVIPGAKIETTFVPLLVYGLTPEEEHRFEHPAEVMGLIDWVHANGGVVVIPHLFRNLGSEERASVESGGWDWWIRKCDALERTWATCRSDDSDIAELAERLSKRVIEGSDAEFARHVGKHRWTVKPKKKTPQAIIESIREKPPRRR